MSRENPFGNFNPFGNGNDDNFDTFRENISPERMKQVFREKLAKSKKQLVLIILFLVIVLGGILLWKTSDFIVDYWWYKSEALTGVFWRRVTLQWVIGGISGILSAVWIALLVMLTQRDAKSEPQAQGLPIKWFAGWKIWLFAIVMGLFIGGGLRHHWLEALKFLHGGNFGTTEPLFGRDVGFYVFTLPFLNTLRGLAMRVLFVSFIASVIVSFNCVTTCVRITNRKPDPTRRLIRWPLIQAALIALLWGLGFWLKRYGLLLSPRGVGWGASYTDVHAQLPAYYALTALSVVIAAGLLWAIHKTPKIKTLGIVVAALGLIGLGLNNLAPDLVQKFIVEPNEFQLEKPYIEYNIASTLNAYGLDKISDTDMEPNAMLTQEDVASDSQTLDNVRLWDFRALIRSYKQLQEIRTYYNFSNVDTDRYTFDGMRKQVMLGVRELDQKGLQNPTWVNTHLEFTHGYGLVMNPAGAVGTNGQPLLWVRDLPPVSSIDLQVKQPKIYFGEAPNHYVFVKTKVKEFDYPLGGSNARSYYEGTGGAPINSLWKRLVYAIAFKDSKILFSDVFTDESRVLWRRQIMERLEEVAPFFTFDSDPYPAVVDGHIQWIVDGYTLTDQYPYSQPMALSSKDYYRYVNYIRNSVKAVVDAHDGHMTFYMMDENEPLIACWNKIFPGLLKPKSEMSAELKSHLRYPEDLFRVQARAYRTYHMTDPNTFYNKEDAWETVSNEINSLRDNELGLYDTLPSGHDELEMDSYYVTLKLPGEADTPEFMMMTPYTPTGRDNMIAWIAGRCDGEHYGELVVKRFSKRTLIYGPNQVAALINQTPEISAQLSLWTQRGSDVLLGHLLVVPVGNSLLYVQPLYLKADRSDLPELKRVIVSSGGQVAWGLSFDEALSTLMGQTYNKITEKAKDIEKEQPTQQDKPTGSIAQQAKEAFDKGQQALTNHDWAAYGNAMTELENLLRQLTE